VLRYHIVLTRFFDLKQIAIEADADQRPRHTMSDVAMLLDAQVHCPGNDEVRAIDNWCARIIGAPTDWALARRLAPTLTAEDVVFCLGEASAFPIAARCNPKNMPKISVLVQNPGRPRVRLACKLFNLEKRIDLFLVNSAAKVEVLHSHMQLGVTQAISFPTHYTDTRFLTPAQSSATKLRPLIGSGGMECRDYYTLGNATCNLDVDVRISAVSPDVRAKSKNLPAVLPDNVYCGFHDWQELRQLYRNSDIVVVSVFDNNYQAGMTTLFEAMACRRPVIMTRIPGLVEDLIRDGVIVGVEPGDVEGLKQAILDLLSYPRKADAIAQKGYDLVMREHNHDIFVQTLVGLLTTRYDSSKTASLAQSTIETVSTL
jgi:glycosyltransferase involved in cell wall biosynthesis